MILDLFSSVLRLSAAGCAAAVIILLIKLAAGKSFTARWHYVIWFLLIIKLIMPVTVSSSISIFNILKPVNKISINYTGSDVAGAFNKINEDKVNNLNASNVTANQSPAKQSIVKDSTQNIDSKISFWTVSAYIWLIGFILMVLFSLFSYLRIYFTIRKNHVEIDDKTRSDLQRYISDLKLNKKVYIQCVDDFDSPFAFWWFGSQIIIPLNVISKMDEKALRSVIAHEAVHIKWNDHIVRPIMLMVLSIHWFNPVVWAAFKMMNRDCESACDAEVIKGYTEDMRKEYAAVLIDMFQTQKRKILINPVLSLNGSNIKKRVMDIMKYRKYSIPVVIFAVIILIIVSVVILTDAKKSVISANVQSVKPEISATISPSENSGTDIENKVEKLLTQIIENGPKGSSNPYDYINNSPSFNELAALKEPGLNYMFESFYKSNADGLREYIMASACAKIIGVFDDKEGIRISSGRDWFYKYASLYDKVTSFQMVDADMDVFPKQTDVKGIVLLPDKVNKKNIEEVVEYYILARNRYAHLTGEKAIEAHKIYRTVEKDGTIILYMQVSFGWFGFENDSFTPVSGSGAIPTRMKLKKTSTGEYDVIEYKEAMDGELYAKSIKDMFPTDLSKLVLNVDEKTQSELQSIQKAKAEKYLEEIGRPNVLVEMQVPKKVLDEKMQKAIYMVANMRLGFPDWNGTREFLIRGGGPAPGIKIRCIFETKCTMLNSDEYEVMLTKKWNITINGKQPISYWKYIVKGESVKLVDSQNNDDIIQTIK